MPKLTTLIICFLIPVSVISAPYKWIDENGKTHYSQTPPVTGEAERINLPAAPSVSSEDARKKLDATLNKLNNRRKTEKQTQQPQDKKVKSKQATAKNCNAVRDNLSKLTNSNPMTIFRMPDGTYKRYTPEQHQQQIERNKRFLRDKCQ